MRKNILKRLIDNLFGADLRRVRKDPMEIMGMEHPSEAAQLYVVRQNPEMIQFIGAPSEKVQLEMVRKDASLIMLLDAPSEKGTAGSGQEGYRSVPVYQQTDGKGKVRGAEE